MKYRVIINVNYSLPMDIEAEDEADAEQKALAVADEKFGEEVELKNITPDFDVEVVEEVLE